MKKKKRRFKTDFGDVSRPSDPEGLFRDLKGRSSQIRHLWSHQADLLRAYSGDHLETSDVALELPTGAGKTLVGLLLAEFRRRRFDDRVAYLCPTRQLAHQVGAHASNYGIAAHVLVGKQSHYPTGLFSEYQLGKAIAITTYSGLFNTNPRIDDPNVIILDDAHAGENYISGLWSVTISRRDHELPYLAIIDSFCSVLPPAFVERLRSNDSPSYGQRDVDLIPGKDLRVHESRIREILDTHLTDNDSAFYSWQQIQDRLFACNVFVSWSNILIRPIIPPTLTHGPFAGARQRVYMSATLGAGGELERITGIRRITRLPIPSGWEQQGSGRRLFLVPRLTEDIESEIGTAVDLMKMTSRSLVLVPDGLTLEQTKADLTSNGVQVIGSPEIESSLDPFTGQTNVALILANRYDGIDLPDESCRLLVLRGLTRGTNLQETFLLSRLAAVSFLRDRMLTRFTQAVGRCTRSDNDYAGVILLDSDLVDRMVKKESRVLLHPELQAELEFGIQNSTSASQEDLEGFFETFLERGEEWQEAEEAILQLRAGKEKQTDTVAAKLREVVEREVQYLYSLWRGDLSAALQQARVVCDSLGGDETKGYRGWWYYLAGDAALMQYEAHDDSALLSTARDCFRRGSKCSLSISWLSDLAHLEIAGQRIGETDRLSPLAVEAVGRELARLGMFGKRFEETIAELFQWIDDTEHKNFHLGLKTLGTLLGFSAENPKEQGAPDCIWALGDLLYIAHEAKSEQNPEGPISTEHLRKTAGHANWVKAHRPQSADSTITCVIETPRQTLTRDAMAHSEGLYRVDPTVVRQMAREIAQVLRSVRAVAGDLGDELLLEKLRESLESEKLLPRELTERLTAQAVNDLPVPGK